MSGPLVLSGTASVSLGTGSLTTNDVLSGISVGLFPLPTTTWAISWRGGFYSIRRDLQHQHVTLCR